MADSQSNETLEGTVKWFNDAKGFGFIEHTSGRDVFVHYSVIHSEGFKTLKDGDLVDYEIKEGPKGLHATKVVPRAKIGAATSPQAKPETASNTPQPLSASIEVERYEPQNTEPQNTTVTSIEEEPAPVPTSSFDASSEAAPLSSEKISG